MPNTLTIDKLDKAGADVAGYMLGLSLGLYSTSGAGTELLGPEGTALYTSDAGTMELRLDYTTIDGEIHVTGLSGWDEGVAAFTASFDTPEPMGVPVWTDMRPDVLYDALLGDSRIDLLGRRGDDTAIGTDFNDLLRMGAGDDIAAGGGGDDILAGGRGNDLLVGGGGEDILRGGSGNDMLVLGDGNAVVLAEASMRGIARGGAGNDIFVQFNGKSTMRGDDGRDVFIFNAAETAEAGNLGGVRSRVVDHKADDLMVFTGVASTAGGNPEGFTGETLADLENGMIDDFLWRETERGVFVRAGDARVVLRDVTADEIDLDQIVFSDQSVQEAVSLFDSTGGGGPLGYFMEPWAFGGPLQAGDGFHVEHSSGGSFIAYGNESTGFATFGVEGIAVEPTTWVFDGF